MTTLSTVALAGIAVVGVLPASTARAAALTPASAPAAAAAGTLPITGFHELVADVAQDRLFFSEGTQGKAVSDSIIVTNLTGKLVATLGGQDGVEGITLSPDGSTLYAALSGDDAVSAINTTSLEETGLYPLGSGRSPYDVAVQSGRVWVSYSSSTGDFVGAIDPNDTPASAFTPLALPSSFAAAPQLVADPENSGTLLASEPAASLATVASYDVATSPVTMYKEPTALGNCQFPSDLSIAPGGAQFIIACREAQQVYRTKTFAETGSYPHTAGQDAVAIAPQGTIAFGTYSAPNVTVYRPASRTLINRFSQTGYQVGLAQSGLAWAADSGTLFAVYQYPVLKGGGVSSHTYRVFAYSDPERTASTITLRGPVRAVFRHRVSITGTLALSVGRPAAGSEITITRTQAGSHIVQRWVEAISASDVFSLTDIPPSPGTYIYTVSYAGTSSIAPTTTTRRVVITKIPTPLTLSVGASTVNYRTPVTVTAHLGATFAGQIVLLYAQSFGSKINELLLIGLVDSAGELSVRYVPSYSTIFTAVFDGDSDYQPATVKRILYVRAGVAESISGYTSSAYIGKTLYRVYEQTNTLTATSAVAPNKTGGCVAFEVDEYSAGAWQLDTMSDCITLDSSSMAAKSYTLSDVIGGQYRIRADFHRTSKDTTNANADSPWSYFLVVS